MSSPLTLVLGAGDVWSGRVPAGSTFILSRGATALLSGPPTWIDGVMIASSQPLSGGTVHTLADAGWVRIEMQQPGQLRVLAPARRWWLSRLLSPRGSRGPSGECVAPSSPG